jgi:hypothetical protein
MKISIKQTIALCALLLISGIAISQVATGRATLEQTIFQNDRDLDSQMRNKFAVNRADIKGSPYYNVSFTTANISPLGKVFSVRYNAALDDMEIIQGNDTLIMNKNNRNYVIKQHIGDVTYKILEDPDSKQDKLGYYVQLSKDAKITLYRKDRKKFVEIETSTYGSNTKGTTAKFKELRSEFYIELGGNGVAIKLSKKKKDVIAIFKGKEDEAKKFIKKNKIKVTREKDLIALIEYMTSL